MRRLLRKKGQSVLEYAVLIVVVVAAVLAVQIYLRRAYQGRVRSSIDSIGQQYDTGNMNIDRTITTANQVTDEYFGMQDDNVAQPWKGTPDQGASITKQTGGKTTTVETELGTRTLAEETLFE